jgi:hypothetical protein
VCCTFKFGLGGKLEIWPYDNDSKQWLFFDGPTHKVLTLRADGHYSHHRSDQAGKEEWVPIQFKEVGFEPRAGTEWLGQLLIANC